ncbi:MAG: hypothetical protein ACR5K3_05855 [Wolbachia sp.]
MSRHWDDTLLGYLNDILLVDSNHNVRTVMCLTLRPRSFYNINPTTRQ